MQGFTITIAEQTETGWRLIADYQKGPDIFTYRVSLTREYAQEICPGLGPEEVVEKALHFLLQREPAAAVLADFDIKQIKEFFPDFENALKEMM